MEYHFFNEIQTICAYWSRHHYCLAADCIEKGIRFFSTSSALFRSKHSYFFLTKILNAFCFFEKNILNEQQSLHRKNSLLFRLFRTKSSNNQKHSALGIAVTLKVSGHSQFLSRERLLQAILHIVPGVLLLSDRYYYYRDESTGLLYIYQELEKKRGRGFSETDIQQLENYLLKELEESVECYTPSVFLIRNEEEIFRNIVQMSREINKQQDIPQVTISFQEHTPRGLLRFSVVVVRLVTKETPSLRALTSHLPHTVQLIPEMTSEIGALDKGYSKQANILTFEIEGALFARKNSSIDLREARSYIAKALELMIGEFRDYNGGLFSKQNKQLKAIKDILGDEHKFFLESLFYAFKPSIFQTFILPESGKACANLFLEATKITIPKSKNYIILKHDEPIFSLSLIKTTDEYLKNALLKEVSNFTLPLHQFGYVVQNINGDFYIGFIYQYPSDTKWSETIEGLIERAATPPQPDRKFLRINFQDGDPLSLNPQLGLDLRCRSLQKALFEGLTRIAPSGNPELAAAKNVAVSEEGKKYIFTLKNLFWSNGEEITAYQFEKTWKNAILSPSCLRPDMFFIIKNAKQARSKEIGIDRIGVRAIDKRTLEVTLEYPAPYFLQMLALPLFFPLYESCGEPYIFCGPYTLHSWKRDFSLILIKNPFYWDFENVKLDGIEISMIRDPDHAFAEYIKGNIDWIGGPFSLLPPSVIAQYNAHLNTVETSGVAWLYCNFMHPGIASSKIRRALSYALDRKRMCQMTFLNPIPLKTHIPSELSYLTEKEFYQAPCESKAQELFQEGLKEIGYSKENLPQFSFVHSDIAGQKELAIEIQRQWQQAFGIKILRMEETWNTFSHQLDNRLTHFGSCYRHPFFNHADYFFNIFYEPTNIHNAFGWSHPAFNQLINLSHVFPHEPFFLQQAERLLLEEMPVIPMHKVTYHYLAKEHLTGIHFCHSGDVDFRWISFK